MQHDSRRWFATSSTQAVESKPEALAAPLLLDEQLLSLIGGGFALTEPPEPLSIVADGPNGSW